MPVKTVSLSNNDMACRLKKVPVWKQRWCAVVPNCDRHGTVIGTQLLVFSQDKQRLKASITVTKAQAEHREIRAEGATPGSCVRLVRLLYMTNHMVHSSFCRVTNTHMLGNMIRL